MGYNARSSEDRAVHGGLAGVLVWTFLILPALYCAQADAASERTEYWPPIWGYSLKVTDTLVATFTLFLFLATCALWYSTKKLVDGASQTAELQLRAYVYVVKTKIKRMGHEWEIRFRLKNFGQTPAHYVRVAYAAKAVAWSNGKAAAPVPHEPDEQDEFEDLGSVGPISDFFEMVDEFQLNATEDELKNCTKAIYLVGKISYDTVFARGLTTNFRYRVGGDMGWDGSGEMNADETGNHAT